MHKRQQIKSAETVFKMWVAWFVTQILSVQCLKKQTGQGISKSKVTKSLRAHKNVRSDFWGLKWKQSIFSLINSIVLATMHANLAILRATAAMQKGGEIDEIALSIYYAPSSAHPVCFFKHCRLLRLWRLVYLLKDIDWRFLKRQNTCL